MDIGEIAFGENFPEQLKERIKTNTIDDISAKTVVKAQSPTGNVTYRYSDNHVEEVTWDGESFMKLKYDPVSLEVRVYVARNGETRIDETLEIEEQPNTTQKYECSNCGLLLSENMNYCPDCGAQK